MMIRSGSLPPLPRDTARAAEAVFGKGNIYLAIGDQYEQLLKGIDFACLDSVGSPVSTRAVLTLVTIFQFTEGLSDRCAVEAIRTRTEWKYALHLPLNYPGFERSVLCRFRQIILTDPPAREVFQQVLDRLSRTGLFRNLDAQRSDGNEVVSSVCAMACLEQLIEAMHTVLETLAAVESRWLLSHSLPHWYERYTNRQTIRDFSSAMPDQLALAKTIGSDAAYLLDAVNTEASLTQLPEIQFLRRVYAGQFDLIKNEARWRLPQCASCSLADSSLFAIRVHNTLT